MAEPTYDPERKGYRVFVGDLGSRVGKYELEREFERYGEVKDIWVARKPPGFAFLVFKHADESARAVRKLHGRIVCGRRVRVEHAVPYKERAAARQARIRGRSDRSYSRSRSRSRERRHQSSSRERSSKHSDKDKNRHKRSRSRDRRSRSSSYTKANLSKRKRTPSPDNRKRSKRSSSHSQSRSPSPRAQEKKLKTRSRSKSMSPERAAKDEPSEEAPKEHLNGGESKDSVSKENGSSPGKADENLSDSESPRKNNQSEDNNRKSSSDEESEKETERQAQADDAAAAAQD